MQQLPSNARVYIIGSYLGGLLALGWFVQHNTTKITNLHVILALVLALVAAGCQVFVVKKTKNNRADHLTPAPIFAALVLLPQPLVALVLIATWLPEWYIHRRKWFIQLWNIAAYLVAGGVTHSSLNWLSGHDHFASAAHLASIEQALYTLLLIPIFLGTHTLLLAWVLKLARGQSFAESGLFAPTKLVVEVGLMCVGLAFAGTWLIHPLLGVAAALPLVLIFDVLHVPNLKEEAETDPKTGLANTRHFNAVMARDLERAVRTGQPLSLLMCDLDYLRNINNTYGHQAGDTVLVGIADIIRRQIRGSDIAARFGGEEFVILLSDTSSDGAYHVAERLRQELEQTQFNIGSPSGLISATISIGVASFPHDSRTFDGLLYEADLAVYQAKRDGRNRVCIAGRGSRELAGEWAREHLLPAPAAPNAVVDNKASQPFWRFLSEATRAHINPDVQHQPKAQPVTSAPATAVEAAKHPRRSTSTMTRTLAFIGVVLLLGLGGLYWQRPTTNVSWVALATLALLTAVAECLPMQTAKRGKTSVSATLILATTFLYGSLGIVTAALTATLVIAAMRRSPIHRIVFNFAMFIVAAEGAGWIFNLFVAQPLQAQGIGRAIVPAVAAGITYYVINHALLCSVRAIAEQRNPWIIWQSEYRWLWPHYTVMGALGLIVAIAYLAWNVIGVVAFIAPIAMLHVAIKQYMDQTSIYVDELQHMNDRLSASYEATLHALTRALDTRDEETEEHSQRVRRYAELIAERLGIAADVLHDISRGALLHDIGKIGIPDAILLKPGKLTDAEREIMCKHPEIGYNMIAHIPFLTGAAQIVLHHHEAYDGTGYPSRLSGEHIPLGARIFAIADTFDAMTSDRPYRKALPISEAFAEIQRCSGKQFDPTLVQAFLSIPHAELFTARNGHMLELKTGKPASITIMPETIAA